MSWFNNLFRKKYVKEIEVVGEDDPNMVAMIKAAYESNGPVYGQVDESGKLTIKTSEAPDAKA